MQDINWNEVSVRFDVAKTSSCCTVRWNVHECERTSRIGTQVLADHSTELCRNSPQVCDRRFQRGEKLNLISISSTRKCSRRYVGLFVKFLPFSDSICVHRLLPISSIFSFPRNFIFTLPQMQLIKKGKGNSMFAVENYQLL